MTTCLGKSIRCTVCVFRERLSVYICGSFPFGLENGMWYLNVLVLVYCLAFALRVLDHISF